MSELNCEVIQGHVKFFDVIYTRGHDTTVLYFMNAYRPSLGCSCSAAKRIPCRRYHHSLMPNACETYRHALLHINSPTSTKCSSKP